MDMNQTVFNDSHYECCQRVLSRTLPMLELAQNCIDCGYDVQQYKDVLQQQYDMARKSKEKFFPNRV